MLEYLNKDKLHHAYLIEGNKNIVIPEVLDFLKKLNFSTLANPDFFNINIDILKIDDARGLKENFYSKTISSNKRVFIVSVNNILLEAQNTLLKIFEEPIENTHIFLIIPDINLIIPTLLSRMFVISSSREDGEYQKVAKKFIKSSISERIDIIKELLSETDDDEFNIDSSRSRALRLLNSIEAELGAKFNKDHVEKYSHLFQIRKFLRQPGSAPKTLLESVALII